MAEVSGREWRSVFIMSLVVMALFSLPYLVGIARSTPQMQFSGFLFALDDLNSYLAKMRFGARDGWQFQILYTSRPHDGGYVFLHFLGLGKLAALASGQGADITARTLTIAYHIARIVCGLTLLLAMYRFLAEFLELPLQRFAAWSVAALAGGLGWLPLLDTRSAEIHLPLEFYLPEGFTFLILFALPHLALARTCFLLGWIAFLHACEKGDWRHALAASALWLGTGLIVPFYIGLLGLILIGWLATLALARRAMPMRELRFAAAAGILPGLYLVYNIWLFSSDPIFVIWAAQNILPSPPPLDYVLAYGVLLVPGGVGAVALWRAGLTHRSALIFIWPIIAAILVYMPIGVQRRLAEGVVVPLAALAVIGIWPYVAEKRKSLLARQAALAVAAGALTISPLLLLIGGMITASKPVWPVFHGADELAALGWLADHAPPDSIVLAAPDSGMILPAFAPVRVYTAQGPEAIDTAETQRAVAAFLGDGMTEAQRARLMDVENVAFLWIGPPERAMMCDSMRCFAPEGTGLRLVFGQGNYTIYAVEEN